MKKFAKLASLFLAAVLCTTGVSAAMIVTEADGVTYESHKVDDRRLARYSPDKTETEFTISDASVNAYAFEGAKNLEKITITDGVFYIGEYAFKDCTSLREVVIDKTWGGVVIPKNAFEGCTSLDPAVIEELCWEKPFTDIFPQDPYYNAVKFVHQNGLMNGVSDYQFAPDTGMTRAMFVTVLGRLAGVGTDKVQLEYDPLTGLAISEGPIQFHFRDVDYQSWYGPYVDWAAATGLVDGYRNGDFGVDDKITIEQAAVILYRYTDLTETPAYDMEADYTDTDEISGWAEDAMRWITAEGIYDGYDGGQLRPKQNAPRALVAEMLYNYVKVYPERDDWGLTLTVADVTPTGLSLTFTQSGGNPSGRLQTGTEYALEVRNPEEWTWVPVENTITGWTEEAILLQMDGETEMPINWEWGYGVLPAGEYRIVKKIMDFRSTGDYDTATFYARFTIE